MPLSTEAGFQDYEVAPSLYIQTCQQQMAMELFGPPISEGVLRVEADKSDHSTLIIERDFFVAVTHTAIEDTLEMPLAVGHVSVDTWRRV